MKLRPRLLIPAFFLAFAGTAAQAQETWDTGFKLVAGNFSGAESALLGQSKNFGVAMFGAYILSKRQSLVFDAGYRFFPGTTTVNGYVSQNDKSDGYYASALFRYTFWRDDVYAHAGLRLTQIKAVRTLTDSSGGFANVQKLNGPYTTGIRPVVGVGARLSDHYSLEFNIAGLESANVDGNSKSGFMAEVGLSIHL